MFFERGGGGGGVVKKDMHKKGAQPRQEPTGLARGQPTSALWFDRWERSPKRCVVRVVSVYGADSPQIGGDYMEMAKRPCRFHLSCLEFARKGEKN